jgi:hypothetical protein
VKLLGPSTEDEMILAFLRAEIESPQYQGNILRFSDARALVDQADPESEQENAARRALLGSYRGYAWALFEGFPNDLVWRHVRLTVDELGGASYANYPTWLILTAGTRLIADGARNVGKGWPCGVHKDPSPSILGIAAKLEKGESFPELIFVSEPEASPDQLVFVEGHTRATAYVSCVYAQVETEIEALVGFSPGIARWRWY